MDNKKVVGIVAGVILLMGGAAAIASYATRESLQPQPVAATQPAPKQHTQKMAAAQPQPAKPACDDKNIVGTVGGGVAGGLVGSQIGKGSGNTAAIIGGVAGGAILGNQYIPTRNVTCP